jgi:hypothetical protein
MALTVRRDERFLIPSRALPLRAHWRDYRRDPRRKAETKSAQLLCAFRTCTWNIRSQFAGTECSAVATLFVGVSQRLTSQIARFVVGNCSSMLMTAS